MGFFFISELHNSISISRPCGISERGLLLIYTILTWSSLLSHCRTWNANSCRSNRQHETKRRIDRRLAFSWRSEGEVFFCATSVSPKFRIFFWWIAKVSFVQILKISKSVCNASHFIIIANLFPLLVIFLEAISIFDF